MERRRSTRFVGKTARKVVTPEEEPVVKKQKSSQSHLQNGVKKPERKPAKETGNMLNGPGESYVSAYEAAIQQNIKERMEMLKMLKIDTLKEEVKAAVGKSKPAKKTFKPRVQQPKDLTPSRRSLRIRGRDPTGAELPPRPASPPALPPPRKLGTQTVADASMGYSDPKDLALQLVNISQQLADQAQQQPPDTSAHSYTEALSSLTVTEELWTKVTPLRITALAFCPLRQTHLLAAGDKRGALGLWDVSRGEDGVHMLSAHTAGIVAVSFSPDAGTRCYTSGYDGLTRCLDLETQQFDEVYATPDSDPDLYLGHHAHSDEHVLLLGRSDGRLVQRDMRLQADDCSSLQLSDRCLRYLSVHPSRPHCLAVVERPSTVSLWDLRQVKGPRSALQRLSLPRACAGVAISRGSGDRLAACCRDDTIRLYDGVTQGLLNPTKTIRHDNNTGRWLTTFKPSWVPGSDELFMVGSMQQPRRIEVFDRDGAVFHLLMGLEMQSICSTVVCHPTEPAVAGANSSGKVFLFR